MQNIKIMFFNRSIENFSYTDSRRVNIIKLFPPEHNDFISWIKIREIPKKILPVNK